MYIKNSSIKEKETKDYALSVSFCDGKLTFALRDYANGIEYRKLYTEDDYNKQLHRKVDLQDVYRNFADNDDQGKEKMAEICSVNKKKVICSVNKKKVIKQSKQKQEGAQETEGKDEGFDKIVYQDGKPKYSVSMGGKITVFNHGTVKKDNQYVEQNYQSYLVLLQVGKISKAKMEMQKNKFSENKKDTNVQVYELKARVQLLDLQNNSIKNQLKTIQTKALQTESQLRDMKEQINKNLKVMMNGIWGIKYEVKEQICENLNQLTKQMDLKLNTPIQEQPKTCVQIECQEKSDLEKQLVIAKQELQAIKQQSVQTMEAIAILQNEIQQIRHNYNSNIKKHNNKIAATDWADSQCYDFKKLTFDSNSIKAPESSNMIIFGNRILNNYYKLTVRCDTNDYARLKNKQYRPRQKNRICYDGSQYYDGVQWLDVEKKLQLKAGETLSMVVNIPTCCIIWKHNDTLVKAQQEFKQLKDTSIKWVPLINIPNGEGISLLEEIWT